MKQFLRDWWGPPFIALVLLLFAWQAWGDISAGTVRIRDSLNAAITLGQKVMASSLPVVIASDQSAISTVQGGLTLTANGQQAVTAVSTALPANVAKLVCIRVSAASTQTVFYGQNAPVLTTANGMELGIGDAACHPVANSSQIFVIAAAAGSTLEFLVFN
jgi:hypothetical protein